MSAGNFLRAFFSCYFLVSNGENEAPVAQSLTWRFFPAGVSSQQVTESVYTGCVWLCAAAQRLFKRVSCRSFLRAPQARRRGRFLTQPSRTTRGRQPLFPRSAARGPCGAALPPRHAYRGVCLHIRDPRGAGLPRPIGRPAPRPGGVTGGGPGPLLTRPGGLWGSPERRVEIAVPGSCGRDSPGLLW